MRKLGITEIKVIDKLCENSQYFSSLIAEYLDDTLIVFDTIDDKKLTLQFKKPGKDGDDDFFQKKAQNITEKIITIVSLLQYLKKDNYIQTGYFAHGRSAKGTIGGETLNKLWNEDPSMFISWSFTEENIEGFIFDLLNLNIIATESLKFYHKKKYRTIEDLRHLQNKRISWAAIGLSFALGITGICLNLRNNNNEILKYNKKVIEQNKEIIFELKNIKEINLQLLTKAIPNKVDSVNLTVNASNNH